MTVIGDDIVCSCRKCYSQNGYGIRLEKRGEFLVCPFDATHKYIVDKGYLKSL